MKEIDLVWDIGTAYDFFISLTVIHDPARYGLRGSWAAGVRSRMPVPEREILQRFSEIIWPLPWVYSLPKPKNGQTILNILEDMPAEQRIPSLTAGKYCPESWEPLLLEVAEKGAWTEKDLDALIIRHKNHDLPRKKIEKKAKEMLALWADASEFADGILSAFQSYHENFYAEEEVRIQPALENALSKAKELADDLSLSDLMLNLSQGVLIEEWEGYERLILVPSFWSTPLMLFVPIDDKTEIRAFGARPANASLVPGEVVPDVLYQALKSLADPTRLRILRYLSDEPLSPAELARRLRLRPPTVLHHLDSLRLARLVQMTISHEGKRYTARPEAIKEVCKILENFLVIDD